MIHCLRPEELGSVLEWLVKGTVSDEHLELINAASEWQVELVALSYDCTKVLLGQKDNGHDPMELIAAYYQVDPALYFSFDEVGVDFVEFLLRHIRDDSDTLEDALLVTHFNMRTHFYAKSVRV